MLQDTYHLKLVNGQEWQIIADQDLSWMSENLAGITELKKAPPNGCRTLFLINDSYDEGVGHCLDRCRSLTQIKKLPKTGWVASDVGLLKVWHHPASSCLIACPDDRRNKIVDVLKIQQTLQPIVWGAVDTGGLLVHSAFVERDGKGAIIAAQGNTGKSTCCRRIPAPWRALCDDESLIVKDQAGQYQVHPFPTWSEYLLERSRSTWDVQQHAPLAAIFFLHRGTKDEVTPLGRGDAALMLNYYAEEANGKFERRIGQEDLRKWRGEMISNAARIANTVPAYILKATLTGEFWAEMERVMF